MIPESSLATPSDDFHDQIWLPLCANIGSVAIAKIQRHLTHEERLRIWKARSQLALEVLLRELAQAQVPGEALALLAQLPTGLDRPDPTDWCHS